MALLRREITNGSDYDLTNLNNGEGVPLSANLNITLHGVERDKTKVFTSATRPLLLPFYHKYNDEVEKRKETFMMMFKTGDDMRQDQLIIQLFSIMNQVLKDVGLDLKFTIYNLIAFTKDDGLLQFVPNSETITKIKKTYNNSIENYLRDSNMKKDENGNKTIPMTEEEYEIVLNNYIDSCAGYCTATYLLGIGDRHLENLMIDKNGYFFHIDFGFIFGTEPNKAKQLLATKLRLTSTMI